MSRGGKPVSSGALRSLVRVTGLGLRAALGALVVVGVIYLMVLLLGSGGTNPPPPKAKAQEDPVTREEKQLHESPFFTELVAAGQLPPLEERIGTEPAVIARPPGRYGGDLWLLAHDIDEVRVALLYLYKGDGLLRYSPEGLPIIPHLAKSVEPSADATVWTVRLRKGAKWSDGAPFTSDDFVWWAENVWSDPDMLGSMPEIWRSTKGPARLEAVDAETFRVIFPDPRPDWQADLAMPVGTLYMPGPRHYLEQFHPRLGDADLIRRESALVKLPPRELFFRKAEILNPDRPGLGPWLLRDRRHQGPWTAVRNPYYCVVDGEGRQLPYLDRLVFRQISKQLQPRAVTDGLVSFAWKLPVDFPSLMSERATSRYRVLEWRKLRRDGMAVTPNRRLRVPPGDRAAAARARLLREPEFRRALSVAINREAIIKAEFDGIGEPASLGPGPQDFGYEPDHLKANAQYDPAKANALLDALGLTARDEAGFRLSPEGEKLHFTIIARPGYAAPLEFITDYWAAVGIRATAQEKPHRLFLQSVEVSDFATDVTGITPQPGNVGALAADAPYYAWITRGGLGGNPDAGQPEVAQPDPLEQKAMRLAKRQTTESSQERKLEIARELLKLARENVWTINVFAPGPEPIMVKEGLRNLPAVAMASFEIGTPFNVFPEAWFWNDPAKINGTQETTPGYHADRRAAIFKALSHMQEEIAPTGKPAGPNRLVAGIFAALGLVVVALAAVRHPYLVKRLALMVPTLLVISVVVFVGVQLPPGSYLETITDNLRQQNNSAAAQVEIERLEKLYHLNDPLPMRYLRWMGFVWFATYDNADTGILQGNLGRSMANGNRPVTSLLGDRLLLTMALSLGAIFIHWVVALPIGVYSAVKQNTPADYALTVGGLIGMCIPDFILALLAIVAAKQMFGAVVIGMFSSQYAMQPYWDWPKVLDLLKHIWVPVLILGTSSTASLIRVIRGNLLDELRKPYVTTARAKGVRPLRLLLKYPFRMALNPFIASIGSVFPALISGSAIVSIILSLPTTGPLLYDSVMLEDTHMAGSLLLCLSALSILGILVSDLLLLILDPRIRFGGTSR